MCEDYRASATFDFALDEADRGSKRIACPVLVLWGGRGKLPELYDDVLGIWLAGRPRRRCPSCSSSFAAQ